MSTAMHHAGHEPEARAAEAPTLAGALADLTARVLGLAEPTEPAIEPATEPAPEAEAAAASPPRRQGALLTELAFLDD